MTRAEVQRLAKAKSPKMTTEVNPHAIDPETRAICRAELVKLKAQEPQAPPPTPEMLEYRRKHSAWRSQMEALRGRVLAAKRCRIIEDKGWALHIVGDGDTWEQAAQQAGLISKPEASDASA